MSTRPPPVPPDNRSPKGPHSEPEVPKDTTRGKRETPGNLAEQGQQGNIRQNTTNQGYQQDR